MNRIAQNLSEVKATLPEGVTLVAVSKTYPPETVMEAYEAGARIFGENRPQEMVGKYEVLPKDIQWHMIGSLQRNKVKYIAPFVALIHSVDSPRLLETVAKEAQKNGRVIDVLMEVHIASEESKQGWVPEELTAYLASDEYKSLSGVRVCGLMGMATFTDDREQVGREFARLKELFDRLRADHPGFTILSMGMSGDYPLAIEHGATMVRIGSAIFGARSYQK